MPSKTYNDPQVLEVIEDQPIVIAGQPASLRGALRLRNPSSGQVVLKSLALTSAGREQAGLSLAGPELRLSPGIFRPGQARPVTLSLSLDPFTPPGEYQAQVEIAGQVRQVVMHVTEKTSLRISPTEVIVENRPGERIPKRIVVSNQGNVPLVLGNFGAIFLDDDLLVCRSLRAAAAAVGDELRPLEEYLARILLETKHVAESSGILRVHNPSGKIDLQPGETRPVDLEIHVPAGLEKRGRFRGVMALYNANLTFVVVPSSGPPAPETETKAPRARAAKGAARQRGQAGKVQTTEQE